MLKPNSSSAKVCFSPLKGTTFFIARNLCSQDHNAVVEQVEVMACNI